MNRREVVVITGATSGVGRALARRFAAEGARVALLARGPEGLRGTVEDVERGGGIALPIAIDVADHAQVDEAARRVVEEWGGIDIWVNNAMTTIFAPFTEIEPEEYQRATEVTYLGVVWGTRAALSHMIPNNEGVIMQVGSALAYRGIPLQSPYCGAKHAIKGFTESVRSELLHYHHDVHLGMVQLPAVNTPQFSHCRSKFDRHPQPVPPIYQPEMIADAIVFAIRERRRETYVAWPTVKTIVGNKLGSGMIDHYLAETGVNSQFIDRPAEPSNERGNLFEPVSGDPGAHGIFDDRSRSWSPQMWLSERRGLVALTLGGAALLGWLATR